jgi:hypothetical protein
MYPMIPIIILKFIKTVEHLFILTKSALSVSTINNKIEFIVNYFNSQGFYL